MMTGKTKGMVPMTHLCACRCGITISATATYAEGHDRALEAALIAALGDGDSHAGRMKLKAIVEAIVGRPITGVERKAA